VAKRTKGLPKPNAVELSKSELLAGLAKIDNSLAAQKRVKKMEDDFRNRFENTIQIRSFCCFTPARNSFAASRKLKTQSFQLRCFLQWKHQRE
jgi:hypothetical protein